MLTDEVTFVAALLEALLVYLLAFGERGSSYNLRLFNN
jgi:hypothetical protein